MNFYTNWSIQSFTQKNFKLPPRNHTELLSIEPSDGGGYLTHLPNNKKPPTISDQVFSAANLAAQKLDKLFPNHPNIGVNLYAYSNHAAPPSFSLHPRVFVQLIPYQFQNIAFGPSFIKLWATKTNHFALYDYYNYTDSHYDMPGGLTLKEAMSRLIHSVRNGSEGTHYETSFSKFATGIPLYILNRYMSDGDSSWQANLNTLVRDLYPEAKDNISRLFSLFYNSPQFNQGMLGNAVQLISKVENKPFGKPELFRINELKLYLQYIHLVYQSRDESKVELKDRLVPLAQYAWQIYDSKIVHSYRIMQLVSYAFLNRPQTDKNYPKFYQLHLDWFPETERKSTKWNHMAQGVSDSQINVYFSSLKKLYIETSESPQLNLSTLWNELQKNFEPKKTAAFGGSSLNRGFFGIYTPQKTEIKIKYRVIGNSSTPLFTISGIDNEYLSPITYSTDKKEGEFKATIPAGATNFFMNVSGGLTYRIEVSIGSGIFYFNSSPRGVMGFYHLFNDDIENYTYDPKYYPSYFFVPKGLSSIEYRVQVDALKLTPPSKTQKNSKVLKTESDFEIRRVDVSKNESGQFWKAQIGNNYNYNMMNLPDVYFLMTEK
ncbi:MAG: hypothetical protein EOP48_15340 [Sphingobacteriales bacterium]|nr:MAG: hypothetical protein EOP48_15340 [Sphingobacteriales bacterium]